MKKIVIADPHPITRRGIKELLQNSESFKVIGEVSNGNELIKVLAKKKPAVLVLELDMPGVIGFKIFNEVLKALPKIKIVVFSSYPEEIYAAHSIKTGAKGYIHKTASANQFLKALKIVISGNTYLSKETRDTSKKSLTTASIKNRYSQLSTREIEVLDLLVAGKRNKDIAALLGINEKTVSTYKSRLLKKLNIKNLAELISHSRALPTL
ncbi:MAG TPA: response regulator transcription factor [Aequorivita sp.]|nr:response regulator transcription factor [Aequorivita sp.]